MVYLIPVQPAFIAECIFKLVSVKYSFFGSYDRAYFRKLKSANPL